MRNKVYKIISIIFIALFMIYGHSFTSFAGSINANEAKVISVASGTFTYKGKTYKAYSSYVNELYSALADDDMDLSADEADSAISYIYGNVKEGIDSGYVYEVKDKEPGNVDLDAVIPESTSKETAKKVSDKEVEDMLKKIDLDQKQTMKYEKKPTASDTDASVYMDDNSITISIGQDNVILRSDSTIVPKALTNAMMIVGALVLTINILIFIILIFKGCMRFKTQERNKPKKGHRVRRKIRKVCRNILTVSTAVAISLILLVLALSVSMFNNNRVMQNIQDSGYFRYAYTKYIGETTVKTYEKLSEITTEADTENSFISYDEYIVKEKVSIDNTFRSLNSESEIADKSIAPYIKRIQMDLLTPAIISFVCAFLACVISFVANIFMDLRRDRGVKSISISVFAGTLAAFILAVLLSRFRVENYFFVEPGYLYSFLEAQMDYIIKILAIIGLFCFTVGMSLVGLYSSMRKSR